MALVNEMFKCIIMVHKDEILNQDAPFLNRFEKIEANLSTLVDSDYINLGKFIYENLFEKLQNYVKSKNNIKLHENYLLTNLSQEDIIGLIYYFNKNIDKYLKQEDRNRDKFENLILGYYVKLFSQDVIAIIMQEDFEYYKKDYFTKEYTRLDKSSLAEYIESNPNVNYSIVYTFSSIYETIKVPQLQNNNGVEQKFMFKFKTVADFENFLDAFSRKKEIKYLIIKMRVEELINLNLILHLINSKKNELSFNPKIFILIHFTRIFKKDSQEKMIKNFPDNRHLTSINENWHLFPVFLIKANYIPNHKFF